MMKKTPLSIFLFGFVFLASCSEPPVEQIKVTVPANIRVPEGMAYIPSGEFIMGHAEDPKTERERKISLQAFLIDKYEVTHERYRVFKQEHEFLSGKKKYPVTRVNYFQAKAFCKSEGNRLPTEMEWEKAARGTDRRKWPWEKYYKHPNDGFSGFIPEEVDKRREWISPYGIYGMGHNVWEWTNDDYAYDGMREQDRGKFKAIRGGLLQTHLTIKFTPVYFRNWMEPEGAYNFIGFRCARDAG